MLRLLLLTDSWILWISWIAPYFLLLFSARVPVAPSGHADGGESDFLTPSIGLFGWSGEGRCPWKDPLRQCARLFPLLLHPAVVVKTNPAEITGASENYR